MVEYYKTWEAIRGQRLCMNPIKVCQTVQRQRTTQTSKRIDRLQRVENKIKSIKIHQCVKNARKGE